MERAMLFRKETPWCGANLVANISLWMHLKNTFPAPFIEIEGRLIGSVFGNGQANSEIFFELHFRALAAQIFGDVSSDARREGAIECGFAKFHIPNACDYQKLHFCKGLEVIRA